MTSRVEELQRMCDNINKNGGLDSEKWHTVLLAQIAQNLAVIADVMIVDRKDEATISKMEQVEGEPQTCEDCKHNGEKHAYDYACDKCTDMDKFQHEDEPQTMRDENYIYGYDKLRGEWRPIQEIRSEPQTDEYRK